MSELSRLAASLSDVADDGPLPVDRWQPQRHGEMDLVIKRDGSWWHEGDPIERGALVRLFSRILRRDEDGYALVTPVESMRIVVEDVPFLAVDYEETPDGLLFRTNVGDRVLLSADHPLTLRRSEALGQDAIYLGVRGRLEARLDRPVYYRLVDSFADPDAGAVIVESGGTTFRLPIGAA